MPFPRLTIRALMAAVAIVALTMGLIADLHDTATDKFIHLVLVGTVATMLVLMTDRGRR